MKTGFGGGGVFILALACFTGSAAVFTSDTLITPTDQTYDGQDVVISNCVVTVDGPHSFLSLRVATGGTLTHLDPVTSATNAGLFLTITNDLEVEPGAFIMANGLGYAGGIGIGAGNSNGAPADGSGGGYGGYGGISSSNAVGGSVYGPQNSSPQLGSGGGNGNGGPGGAGGGLVQLTIGGRLIVNGAISANGLNATNSRAGGGSGGAIWSSCNSFEGAGSVSANGGAGEPIHGGGGGGGRLFLLYNTNSNTGTLSAAGGAGWQIGGAGTICHQPTAGFGGRVIVDNTGSAGASTLIDFSASPGYLFVQGNAVTVLSTAQTMYYLVVRSNSVLTSTATNTGSITITTLNDATIEQGAQVVLDGRGFAQNTGTGVGQLNGSVGGGAGHGGYGGSGQAGSAIAIGGNVYDSTPSPNLAGSGGRGIVPYSGGAGGGVVRLNINGNLQLDGRVSADATSGTGGSGGGSGGAIWLTVGTLTGAGTISANGGSGGLPSGGGGAGGKISITYGTNTFIGTISAHGGAGAVAGGAGTIYSIPNYLTSLNANLTADNGGLKGANTLLDLSTLAQLSVLGGAGVTDMFPTVTLSSLVVSSNSVWFPNVGVSTATVSGNATVMGAISVDGGGTSSSALPSNLGSGGGGNGGSGGRGAGAPGGFFSGVSSTPTSLGTRGGSYIGLGPNGGGALHLTVNGLLTINGSITANGLNISSNNAGGGAGGSLWLTLGGLAGSGLIGADGGSGHLPLGGGGSGGRIAVYYNSNLFTGLYSAKGGAGFGNGAAGTLYLKSNLFGNPSFIADNGGLIGTNTPLDVSSTIADLKVLGGAWVSNSLFSSLTVNTLTVASNSIFTPGGANSSFLVTVSSNATIAGLISCDAISSSGNNPGQSSSPGSGGGGGGGAGGNGLGAPGGGAFGSISSPTATGGRGGSLSSPFAFGGGALKLAVNGLLVLDGRISANGGTVISNSLGGSGGGGGGSIWVTAQGFGGKGAITADGGTGTLPYSGGGGGGHIAVLIGPTFGLPVYTNVFNGAYSAKGGAGFVNGGAGSIYVKTNTLIGNQARLTFDNGGLTGPTTNSLLDFSATSVSDVIITGGCTVTSVLSSISLTTLTVGSNSTLLLAPSTTMTLFGASSVASGGAISADGAGTAPGPAGFPTGSGGGGHAGTGGSGFGGPGGNTSGNATSPTSQGGRGGFTSTPGPNGGGALHLAANGLLTLNGRISANGTSISSNNAGGGAGGSVWLSLGGLTGSGLISADGGNGNSPAGGGGGGGRIALTFTSNSFAGTLSAKGGSGFMRGGAGTIYTKTNSSSVGTILVDNGGLKGTNTDVNPSGTFDLIAQGGGLMSSIGSPRDLILHSNGWVGQGTAVSVPMTINRNVTIEQGGGFNFDGANSVFGGFSSPSQASGGGHGGNGGRAFAGFGLATDSVTNPVLGGDGGGNGSGNAGPPLGGRGGGRIALVVANTLRNDGQISAVGLDGDVNSGGGAGGGIYLSTPTFSGQGSISANGGRGNGPSGGGGGGRIAIFYTTNLFTGLISAAGGIGYEAGGAGTIYVKSALQTNAQLTLDNQGASGAKTPLSSSNGLAQNLNIANGAIGQFQGILPVFSNITVSAGGRLTGSSSDTNVYLAIAGNMNITAGAIVEADGDGNPVGNGSGAGATLSNKGAGGGYGGTGGSSSSGAAGGSTYGSNSQPIDRGSGGGLGGTSGPGSEGGGAIRLAVAGQLTVDGRLSVNGNDGLQDDSGGGSGGSLWISANNLTGAGTIAANGGAGELFGGGGGGGGRIAIYSPNNTFSGQTTVTGGNGASSGSAGTIFSSIAFPGLSVISQSPAGTVSNIIGLVQLGFSSPIDPSSLPNTAVTLATPNGNLNPGSIQLSEASPSVVNIAFPLQNTPGAYRVEFGPGVQDLLGQTLSQVYTGAFTISIPVITGTVRDTNGAPIAGVLVQETVFPSLSTTTDNNGTYSIGVDLGWTGSIVPSLGNSLFAPGSRSYTNVLANLTGQDYLLVQSLSAVMTAGLQGTNFALTWYGISGVNYQPQYSTNLTDWLPYNGPLPGTNGPSSLLIPIDPASPQEFFRLQSSN
jgi:hypothetical protein